MGITNTAIGAAFGGATGGTTGALGDLFNQPSILKSKTLLGEAPSVETFAPFQGAQAAQRDELISRLLGGSSPFGATPGTGQGFIEQAAGFQPGGPGGFQPVGLRDPNQQFQSFSNVEDQLRVIQEQGTRSLQQGLQETRGQFGGAAFSSDARNALERQQARGIQGIGDRQTQVLSQALETANQRNFQSQQAGFGQNLQSRLQAQNLQATGGAQQAQLLAQLGLGQQGFQSQERIGQLGQLSELLNTANVGAISKGGSSGLAPGLIAAGGAILGGIASDRKLKKDITHFDTGTLAKLRKLSGAKWRWKDNKSFRNKEDGRKSGGVIAQEVQKAGLGELVHEQKSFNIGNGKEKKHLTVDYHGLTGAVITAIRELADKVDKLENK